MVLETSTCDAFQLVAVSIDRTEPFLEWSSPILKTQRLPGTLQIIAIARP